MDDHTLARIAQEWATFKRRLDSAYPETRGTEGYLGGLVESQRTVLDALITPHNRKWLNSNPDSPATPAGALKPSLR